MFHCPSVWLLIRIKFADMSLGSSSRRDLLTQAVVFDHLGSIYRSAAMSNEHPSRVLERFFTGISEYVFYSRLGVADTQLIDYVSGLLIRFTRTEITQKVRAPDGRPALQIATMLSEAEQRLGEAKREVHQHIGDYTLFWSGLYPESLRNESKEDKDQFVSYCTHGKRSYLIASTIEGKETGPPCDLLARLSKQFELCAYGLREIRREWERRDGDDSQSPLLI